MAESVADSALCGQCGPGAQPGRVSLEYGAHIHGRPRLAGRAAPPGEKGGPVKGGGLRLDFPLAAPIYAVRRPLYTLFTSPPPSPKPFTELVERAAHLLLLQVHLPHSGLLAHPMGLRNTPDLLDDLEPQ